MLVEFVVGLIVIIFMIFVIAAWAIGGANFHNSKNSVNFLDLGCRWVFITMTSFVFVFLSSVCAILIGKLILGG